MQVSEFEVNLVGKDVVELYRNTVKGLIVEFKENIEKRLGI